MGSALEREALKRPRVNQPISRAQCRPAAPHQGRVGSQPATRSPLSGPRRETLEAFSSNPRWMTTVSAVPGFEPAAQTVAHGRKGELLNHACPGTSFRITPLIACVPRLGFPEVLRLRHSASCWEGGLGFLRPAPPRLSGHAPD
ncbi:hypothetical protein AAFF_G00100940 [Aldrovandia affinis]|uniref:Uncharacterized protein n=1 Tax=Aldrovandia affinis TaxID=143900 RepID=A0AAD7RUQ2_9TELE|nr:hypothetical protein AAFF_G00100940 [Aldrovandia affinis]